MLGSVIVSDCLDDGTTVNIEHVFIEVSSQWIIGCNVTSKCENFHTDGNYLKLEHGVLIPLENIDLHSYSPFSLLIAEKNMHCSNFHAKLFCSTGNLEDSKAQRPWSEMKKIVNKVYK